MALALTLEQEGALAGDTGVKNPTTASERRKNLTAGDYADRLLTACGLRLRLAPDDKEEPRGLVSGRLSL